MGPFSCYASFFCDCGEIDKYTLSCPVCQV